MKMREKKVCELENGSIKIIQSEEQREKSLTKGKINSQRLMRQSQVLS